MLPWSLISHWMWSLLLLQVSLELLLDPYVLLGLVAIQPMLESIDALYVWAQKSDAFICDFIAALEVCEGQLYTFYVDHTTSYGRDDFWALSALLECSYESIQLKWIYDLNETSEAHLAFMVAGEQHFAMHGREPVSKATFSEVVATVKRECASKSLGLEFDFFPILKFFILPSLSFMVQV
jgi:hypothetical protein